MSSQGENCSVVSNQGQLSNLTLYNVEVMNCLSSRWACGSEQECGRSAWKGTYRHCRPKHSLIPKASPYSQLLNLRETHLLPMAKALPSVSLEEDAHKGGGSAVARAASMNLLQTHDLGRKHFKTEAETDGFSEPQGRHVKQCYLLKWGPECPEREGCHLPFSACALLFWLPDYY